MTTTLSPMSIKLDSDTRERLNNLAARRKRTSHALAKEAIEAYVARQEAHELLNREALEAWNHFQDTGLHITGEEAATWIESWGTPNELPPPKCHD